MDRQSPNQQVETFLELIERLPRLMKSQEGLKSFGLTKTQAIILYFLNNSGNQKATELAKYVGLTAGAITQVCDELEQLGFVERVRSSDDRRVVHIAIMDKGRQALADLIRVRSVKVNQLLEELGPHDTSELIRIVGRVVHILENNNR